MQLPAWVFHTIVPNCSASNLGSLQNHSPGIPGVPRVTPWRRLILWKKYDIWSKIYLPGNWPFPFPVWHFLSRCWTLFPVWRDMDEYRNITYYSMYHVTISTILIPTKHPVVGSPRILPWNWPRLDVCFLDFRWSLRWLCCLPSFERIVHRLKPRRGFQPDFWGKLISGSLNMI